MHISERLPGDADELTRLIRGERDAEQRDRYRVVRLAIERHATVTIMTMTARSRDFVQRCWRRA